MNSQTFDVLQMDWSFQNKVSLGDNSATTKPGEPKPDLTKLYTTN